MKEYKISSTVKTYKDSDEEIVYSVYARQGADGEEMCVLVTASDIGIAAVDAELFLRSLYSIYTSIYGAFVAVNSACLTFSYK